MKAMVFGKCGEPLQLKDLPIPQPDSGQVLIKVKTCGVCRTDLHIVEGDLVEVKPQLVLGHEIVGVVEKIGENVSLVLPGMRVGVAWLGHTCGHCGFCAMGMENLCDQAKFTGYQIDGGFAEYHLADEKACYPLPAKYSDVEIAPLMCAGLIGYRSYKMADCGSNDRLALYGFGAAAHIICQVACQQGVKVYAFTRPGDNAAQQLALQLGAVWAGSSSEMAPELLDAAIIFAAVGALVPQALSQVRKSGKVVCAGIHMSPIPEFSYDLLWGERSICSVANLTRQDGVDFLKLAAKLTIQTHVQLFPLEQANQVLTMMAESRLTGAAVLAIDS